jgi:hypothetical protein
MCAACGVPTHVPIDEVTQPAKFAALRVIGVYGVGAYIAAGTRRAVKAA